MSDWNLRNDLALFGINLPERFSIDEFAAKLKDQPLRNTAILAGLAALLFYQAEKEKNPKVNDVYDALVYSTTCLSVGYGDIFAQTPAGKVLGSLLMLIGPAMAAKTMDGPELRQRDPVQSDVLKTLHAILEELKKNNGEGARFSL